MGYLETSREIGVKAFYRALIPAAFAHVVAGHRALHRREDTPHIGPLRSSLFRHKKTSPPLSKIGLGMGAQRTSGGLRRELLAVLGI
jgi:hypothetical protein